MHTTETVEGTLHFEKWNIRPWNVLQEDGEQIDLHPHVEEALEKLAGKKVMLIQKGDSIRIVVKEVHDKNAVTQVMDHTIKRLMPLRLNRTSDMPMFIQETLQELSGKGIKASFTHDSFEVCAVN